LFHNGRLEINTTIISDIDLAERFLPIQLDLLKNFHRDQVDIKYSKWEDEDQRDIEQGIDCDVYLANGQKKMYQLKVLRNSGINYQTLCIEYWQNRFSEEKGELFHVESDLFLTGYSTKEENAYQCYRCVKVPEFKLWLKDFFAKIKWGKKEIEDDLWNRRRFHKFSDHSRASFLAIPYLYLPDSIITQSYN